MQKKEKRQIIVCIRKLFFFVENSIANLIFINNICVQHKVCRGSFLFVYIFTIRFMLCQNIANLCRAIINGFYHLVNGIYKLYDSQIQK